MRAPPSPLHARTLLIVWRAHLFYCMRACVVRRYTSFLVGGMVAFYLVADNLSPKLYEREVRRWMGMQKAFVAQVSNQLTDVPMASHFVHRWVATRRGSTPGLASSLPVADPVFEPLCVDSARARRSSRRRSRR